MFPMFYFIWKNKQASLTYKILQIKVKSWSSSSRGSVSHSVVSDSLWPRGLWPARLLRPWDSPGKSTGVDCHSLLQGIFPTQGSNPGHLNCRQILYRLSYRKDQVAFSSAQSLSRVRLFATPWIAAHQASLSITNSRSSLRLKSIESVMPSSHLILCHPLFLLLPIPPSIRVFSNESTLCMRWPKYWSIGCCCC